MVTYLTVGGGVLEAQEGKLRLSNDIQETPIAAEPMALDFGVTVLAGR